MSHCEDRAHCQVAGHSSNVQLLLVTPDGTYPLAEIGPHFVTLREPADLTAGNAEIVMRVDGRESRWQVMISESTAAVPFDLEVATVDR